MISKKNIYSLQKTKNFLQEYPFILIYQHNNLTVKQRINLKRKLQSLTNVKTLTVKNSIVDKAFSFLENQQVLNRIQNLLEGPLFLLGCQNREQVQQIWNLLSTSSSFLFLGSQYENQVYTHLDIQKSLELNNTVYYEFLNLINQQLSFQNSGLFFDQQSNLYPLFEKNSIFYQLVSLLENETFRQSSK